MFNLINTFNFKFKFKCNVNTSISFINFVIILLYSTLLYFYYERIIIIVIINFNSFVLRSIFWFLDISNYNLLSLVKLYFIFYNSLSPLQKKGNV